MLALIACENVMSAPDSELKITFSFATKTTSPPPMESVQFAVAPSPKFHSLLTAPVHTKSANAGTVEIATAAAARVDRKMLVFLIFVFFSCLFFVNSEISSQIC